MFTPLDICAIALTGLQDMPIASFEAGTKAAILCKATFHLALRQTLAAYPWNCATARATLPRLVDPPAHGFAYQYQLPADCLFVQKVLVDSWRVEGARLLTDADAVAIVYTADLSIDANGAPVTGGSPLAIDTLCANATAYRLGYMIAAGLTGSASRGDAMFEQLRAALAEAEGADAMTGTPEVIDGSSWVDVE